MPEASPDSVEYFYGFGRYLRTDTVPTDDRDLKIQNSLLRTGLTTVPLPARGVCLFKFGNCFIVLEGALDFVESLYQ